MILPGYPQPLSGADLPHESLYFNGSAGFVASLDDGTGWVDFTMEAWVRPDAGGSDYEGLIGYAYQDEHCLYKRSTGAFEVINAGGLVHAEASTFSTSVWTHIAYVADSSEKAIYVDGTEVYSSSGAVYVGHGKLLIGCNTNSTVDYDLDDLLIENFKGYLYKPRLVMQRLYTANFTPPVDYDASQADTEFFLTGKGGSAVQEASTVLNTHTQGTITTSTSIIPT